ncbi:MAG: M23 family metallopeptidase [Leptospiraceae bacterium]
MLRPLHIFLFLLCPAILLANSPDSDHTSEAVSGKKNRWRALGQSTRIFSPDDFTIGEPEQLTFRLEGVRMDAYSRGFAQGDIVYLEIIRPPNVHGFYSYLYNKDGEALPLTRTKWGYRILLPIGAQDEREKIELVWKQSVSDWYGRARIEIPINEKSFPQTRWYNRVSQLLPDSAPPFVGGEELESQSDRNVQASMDNSRDDSEGSETSEVQDLDENPGEELASDSDASPEGQKQELLAQKQKAQETREEQLAREEESEEKLSNFMKKITLEKSLRSQVFERQGNDLITSRLSHPRDMHYITSQCFTSRLKISYKYVNGKKVEVGRRVVMHNGVDLRGRPGTPIYAIADGQVVLARSMHFEGNFTVIDHGLGVFSGYMHQSNLRVQVGQYVRAGERIGDVGNTGYSTGPHLHLALWIRGIPVDPLSLYSLPIRE